MSNEDWRTRFYTVQDVMEYVGVSKSKAYQIMQKMNKELESRGYDTVAGRVPRKYFHERFYC